MPQVAILRRDRLATFQEGRRAEDKVSVAYSAAGAGFLIVLLPLDLYRPASEKEIAQAPDIRLVPVDLKAQQAEARAIADDLARRKARPTTIIDVP